MFKASYGTLFGRTAKSRRAKPGLILAVGLMLLCMACALAPLQTIDDGSSQDWTTIGDRPKIVAVLPFTNETDVEGLDSTVRESLASHLSPLNFQDRELGRVDSILTMYETNEKKSWRKLSSRQLGDMLRAELLIYGRVKSLKKYYFGIYAQMVIEVEARIVTCENGAERWHKTITTRTHEGGLPFDLFSIAPAAVRSGMLFQKEKLNELVDQLNRALVAEIPNPPFSPSLPTVIEVQIASFKDRLRAEKTLQAIRQRGLKPHIKDVALGSEVWHRVMLGPFYSMAEANQATETVRQYTHFKPILIQQAPAKKDT